MALLRMSRLGLGFSVIVAWLVIEYGGENGMRTGQGVIYTSLAGATARDKCPNSIGYYDGRTFVGPFLVVSKRETMRRPQKN